MYQPTAVSLFSGIAGVELAAEVVGFKTLAFCEREPFCQAVLRERFPGVPIFDDVKAVTADALKAAGIKQVDLLSGGFPCQPFSTAGERRGEEDERHLWPEFARIICEVRSRWVLAENVPGLFSIGSNVLPGGVFGAVLRDLAKMGYRVGWCCYGADDVGAPHKRDRVFILGYLANANCPRELQPEGNVGEERRRFSNRREDVADAGGQRRQQDPRGSHGHEGPDEGWASSDHHQSSGHGEGWPDVANPDGRRERQHQAAGSPQGAQPLPEQPDRRATQSRLGGTFDELPAWLDGSQWPAGPGEEQHSHEPPRTGQGIPNRVARLKALGNAVNPAQVFPTILAIYEQIMREHTEGAG